MGEQDIVIIAGLVGVSVIAVTLLGGKIKSFFKIMGLENQVKTLENTIEEGKDTLEEVKETRGEQYADLGGFYQDAVDKINALNQTVGDLTNKITEQVQDAAITVSDTLAGESITDLISRNVEDTIAQVKQGFIDAGGMVNV